MENRPDYLTSQSVDLAYDADMAVPTYYQVSGQLENQVSGASVATVTGLDAERPDVLALATAALLQGSYSDTSGYIPVHSLVLSQQQCAQFTQLGAVMGSSLGQGQGQGSSGQEDVSEHEGSMHDLTGHERLIEVHTTHAGVIQGQTTRDGVLQEQTTHAGDIQGQISHVSSFQGQSTQAGVIQGQTTTYVIQGQTPTSVLPRHEEDQLVAPSHVMDGSGLQGPMSEMHGQSRLHGSLIELPSMQQVEAGLVFGGQQGPVGGSPLLLVKPTYTSDSMVMLLNSASSASLASDVLHYSNSSTPATESAVEKKKRAARAKPASRKKDGQGVNAGSSKKKPIQTLPPDGIISSEDLGGLEMTSNTIIALMKKKFNKKGLKINECPYCKKGLSSREALRTHLRTHTGERPYQCEDCGKSFSDCSVFRRHQRIHTGEKPYVCDVCGKAFNQSTSLESHRRTHTGTKKYTCEVCGQGWDKLQQLVDHCRSEKHGDINTYKCPKCSVEVQDEGTLKRHMCSHTGERPYCCHICGAKWEKQYALMEHLRMHAGIKPYDCPECEEKFVRKGDLRVHMNRHTVNRFTPHKCGTCGEGFKQKAQLMVHERIHSGVRPYACRACGKSFYSWKDLREHRRKHSGKRIYKCDHCAKTFATMNTLKIHVKMHMKGGAISCSVCSQAFQDPSEFVHHTRFDHKQIGENSDSNSEDAESVTVRVKRKHNVKNGNKKESKLVKSSEQPTGSDSSEETSSDVRSIDKDNGEDIISSSDSYSSDGAESPVCDQSTNSSLQDNERAGDDTQSNHLAMQSSLKAGGIADSDTQSVLGSSDVNSGVLGASQAYYPHRGSGIENLVRASVLSDAASMQIQDGCLNSESPPTVASSMTSVMNSHPPSTHSGCQEGPVLKQQDEAGAVSSGHFTLLTAVDNLPTVSMMSSLQDLTPVVPSSVQLMYSSSHTSVNSECPPVLNSLTSGAEYVHGFKGLIGTVGPLICERVAENHKERYSQVIQEPDYAKKIHLEKGGDEMNIEQRIEVDDQQSASQMYEQNKCEILDSNVDKPQTAVSQELHYHQVQVNQDQSLAGERIESVHVSQQIAGQNGQQMIQTGVAEHDTPVDVQSQVTAGEGMELDASSEGKGSAESQELVKEGTATIQSHAVENSSLELANQDQFIRCSQEMSSTNCQDNGYLSYVKYLTLPSSLDDAAYTSAIKDYTNSLSYSLQLQQAFHPQAVAAYTTEASAQETRLYVERGFESVAYNLPHVSSVFAEHTSDSQAAARSVDSSVNLQTLINTSLAQEAAEMSRGQQRKEDKGYSRKCYKNLECQYCGKGLSSVPALKNHEMIHTGERPYKCECGKSFIDSSTFKRHQRIHTGIKPYMCDICGKQFNQSNSYRTHMTCHTGEKHYKCNVCGLSFDKLKKLMEHNQRENHGSVKKHTCSVCSAVFRDVAALDRHMCSHTGEKAFKCEYCNKSYEKQYQFKEHMHSHAGFKPFKCEICGDSFLRKGQLKFHVYKHQYGRQFECEFCHQAFYRSTDLTVHRRIHTGEKPFKCDQCHRSFRQKWECKNHQLWDHSTVKPFTCDRCFKTFKKSYSLKLHIQNKHENEKQHKCIVCKKRFRKLENLRKHTHKHRSLNCRLCDKSFLTERKTQQHMERFHKDDRRVIKITKRKEKQKLECLECGKKFCFRYDLDEHKRLHSGENVYKCTVCSKTFSREYHLNIHTMKHTGEKRFRCDECDERFTSGRQLKTHRVDKHGASEADVFTCSVCQRQFADRNTMKKHVKSHSGDKPYQCQTCGRSYQYSWNLKIHQKASHTGDMPFSCRFCQKMFTHRRDYRNHVRSHTDNLPYRCSDAHCGRSFASLRALRMHQPVHFPARSSAPVVVTNSPLLSVPVAVTNSPLLSVPAGVTNSQELFIPAGVTNSPMFSASVGVTTSPLLSVPAGVTNSPVLSAASTEDCSSAVCGSSLGASAVTSVSDREMYSQNDGGTLYKSSGYSTNGRMQIARSDADGQSYSQNGSGLIYKLVDVHTSGGKLIASGTSDVEVGQTCSQYGTDLTTSGQTYSRLAEFDTSVQGDRKESAQSTSDKAAVLFEHHYSQNSSIHVSNSIRDKSTESQTNKQIYGGASSDIVVIHYPQNDHSEKVQHIYNSLQTSFSGQRDSPISQKLGGIEFKNDVEMHTDNQKVDQLNKLINLNTDSHHLSTVESVGNIQQCFVRKETSTVNSDIDNGTDHHQKDLSFLNTDTQRAISSAEQHTQMLAVNISTHIATSYFHQSNSSTRNIQPEITTSYAEYHQNTSPNTNNEPHTATVNEQHLKGLPIMSSRVSTSGNSAVEDVSYMSSNYIPNQQTDESVAVSESVPCSSQVITTESVPCSSQVITTESVLCKQTQNTLEEHGQLKCDGRSHDGRLQVMSSNQHTGTHDEQDSACPSAGEVKHSLDTVVSHSNGSANSTVGSALSLHRDRHSSVSHTGEHVNTALADYHDQPLETLSHVFVDGNPINYSLPFYKNINTSSQQQVPPHFGEHVHMLPPYDKVYELSRSKVDEANHGKAASAQSHSSDVTAFTTVMSTMHEPALSFPSQRSSSPWNRAAISVMSPSIVHGVSWSGHVQSSDAWNRNSEPATTPLVCDETRKSENLHSSDNPWNTDTKQARWTPVNEPEKRSYLQWSDSPWIRTSETHPVYTSVSAEIHTGEAGAGSGDLTFGQQQSSVQSAAVQSSPPATVCHVSQTHLSNASGHMSRLSLRIPKYKYFDEHISDLTAGTESKSESEDHVKNSAHLHLQIPVSSVVSQALTEVSQSFHTSQYPPVSVERSSVIHTSSVASQRETQSMIPIAMERGTQSNGDMIPTYSTVLEKVTESKAAIISGLKSDLCQTQSSQCWKKCRFVKEHSLAKNTSGGQPGQPVDTTCVVDSSSSVAPVYTTNTLTCQTTVSGEASRQTDKPDSEDAVSHAHNITGSPGTPSSSTSDT